MKEIKEQTETEIIELYNQLPNIEEMHKKAIDVCYCRTICKTLGIDYNNLPNIDYWKAYIFCYFQHKGSQ